ncbi:MAG: transglycosylase SLT domain-containing protein [Nitrosospira sp.]
MQFMPDTARRNGVTGRFDPVQNLFAGARYLNDLMRMFNLNPAVGRGGVCGFGVQGKA